MADVPAGDSGGMDFNDPEPEPDEGSTFTQADLNKALTGLFQAMGKGAQRKHISDALVSIAGVAQPRDVPEEGLAKVIAAVDAMTAKYASGKLKLA